ncbi:MAG: hypothetical protein ACRDSH_13055 [Pseudonocardiaceae bacterium]
MPLSLDNADAFLSDTGNLLDLATPESRQKAMQSQLDIKPPTDDELANFDTASRRAGEKTDLAPTGGNLNQLAANAYNADNGGYQFLTQSEYNMMKKNRPKGPLQMEDITGTDAGGRRGVYVFMAGATGLSLDNYSANQAEIWAQMAPQERRDYLNARANLSTLRSDAPQRYQTALRANDLAVSAQQRYLANEFNKGTKATQIKGGFFTGKDMSFKTSSSVDWDQTPNFVVWQEQLPNGQLGMKSIKTLSEVYSAVLNDVETDRHKAGEMVIAMLAANMIDGASAKYAGDYIGYDKNGKPIAQWNPADWNDNLRFLVQEVAKRQVNGATPGTSMDSFQQVVKNTAAYNNATATTETAGSYPGSGSGGGGGGYGGYGGGGGYYGGGGSNNRVFLSDAALLGSQLDSIARARLGRVANADEKKAFIDYFHQLETQYSAAYVAGGAATQPDVQGQAVAWIESHNSGEQAGQTAGEYISALAEFLRGPGLSSSGG